MVDLRWEIEIFRFFLFNRWENEVRVLRHRRFSTAQIRKRKWRKKLKDHIRGKRNNKSKQNRILKIFPFHTSVPARSFSYFSPRNKKRKWKKKASKSSFPTSQTWATCDCEKQFHYEYTGFFFRRMDQQDHPLCDIWETWRKRKKSDLDVDMDTAGQADVTWWDVTTAYGQLTEFWDLIGISKKDRRRGLGGINMGRCRRGRTRIPRCGCDERPRRRSWKRRYTEGKNT